MTLNAPLLDFPSETVVDPALQHSIEQFLFYEARLLDSQRFDDWLELFTDDAIYWVPSEPGQEDFTKTASIMCEDKNVLRMRVRRLGHPRAPALEPFPRTCHIVGNVTVSAPAQHENEIDTISTFLLNEFRNDKMRSFSGYCRHILRRTANVLKIAHKRVDLINCDGLNEAITIPF